MSTIDRLRYSAVDMPWWLSIDWQVLNFCWLCGRSPVHRTGSLSTVIYCCWQSWACACLCMFLIAKSFEIFSPYCLVFSNGCETPKMPIIFTLTHMSESIIEIGHRHISFSPPFSFFIWIPPKSSFSTLSLENIDEVQRSGWSLSSCLMDSSSYWSSLSQ